MGTARKFLTGAGIAAGTYGCWVHRLMRCGATGLEIAGPFPGAALAPDRRCSPTMAVTIGARLEQVWSWLVQSGSDRVAAPLLRQRLQPMLERDMVNIEDRLEAGGDQLPKPGKDI